MGPRKRERAERKVAGEEERERETDREKAIEYNPLQQLTRDEV